MLPSFISRDADKREALWVRPSSSGSMHCRCNNLPSVNGGEGQVHKSLVLEAIKQLYFMSFDVYTWSVTLKLVQKFLGGVLCNQSMNAQVTQIQYLGPQ